MSSSSGVFLALGKAALCGAGLGLGAALVMQVPHHKTLSFLFVTISSIALRAIAWYIGLFPAIGALAGILISGVFTTWGEAPLPLIQGGFAGTTLVYLIEQFFRAVVG